MSIHQPAPGSRALPLCAAAKHEQGRGWGHIVLEDVEDGFLVTDGTVAIDCPECIKWVRA